jgi:hypothetical protein
MYLLNPELGRAWREDGGANSDDEEKALYSRNSIIPLRLKMSMSTPELRIRIHLIRIRIQHFRLNTDLDPIWIQGFNDQKMKKVQLKKLHFFGSKTTIYLSIKNVQVTEETFRSQKRPSKSNTSKHELKKNLLLWVIFALLDPDPLTLLNPDLIRKLIQSGNGSGSATLSTLLYLQPHSPPPPRPMGPMFFGFLSSSPLLPHT